jgi:hypothetical protein
MDPKRSVIEVSDEALAASAPTDVPFGMDDARRVARLAFLISADDHRKKHPLEVGAPRWEELPPDRQAAAAAGAFRVVQALMLLGWIEQP